MMVSNQQLLPFAYRRGASFDEYLPGNNAQVVELLQTQLLSDQAQSIVLWGLSGLGKTHLLQAACQTLHQAGQQTHYIPLAERRVHPVESLDGLESSGLVCLDDLQHIAGDRDWEAAIFKLYHALLERGGTLLVSADNAPTALQLSLADLQSRLSGGVVLYLQTPDDAGREQLLQWRVRQLGMSLPEPVAAYLLSHCQRDVASLWKVLSQLEQETLSRQKKLSLRFVKSILEE